MVKIYAWFSYISGNMPIALIFFLNSIYDRIEFTDGYSWTCNLDMELFFAFICVGITSVSSFLIKRYFDNSLKRLENGNGGSEYLISDLRVKKLFSSGAITYYILPFASFVVGDDVFKNLIALCILTIIFGKIYVKERMTVYSPILCLAGYVVFSCTINASDSTKQINVLFKNPGDIFLEHTCRIVVQNIDNETYLGIKTKS